MKFCLIYRESGLAGAHKLLAAALFKLHLSLGMSSRPAWSGVRPELKRERLQLLERDEELDRLLRKSSGVCMKETLTGSRMTTIHLSFY